MQNDINIDVKNAASGSLDTLAQLRKGQIKQSLQRLDKKNRRKWFTRSLSAKLIALNTKNKKYYQSAYYCNDVLIQNDYKLTGKYCNTRICNVCNSIRTGKLINGYSAPIKALSDPYFITLTVPNVPASELRDTLLNMKSTFVQIKDVFRKRHEQSVDEYMIEFNRSRIEISYLWASMMVKEIPKYKYERLMKGYTAQEKRDILDKEGCEYIKPLTGIRKVEITYNTLTKEFHPHFHLIVEGGLERANEIINMWLQHFPDANRKAQDARKADNNSMIELFKYATKLVGKAGQDKKSRRRIELYAIDTITTVLYNQRTFQTYGGIRRVSEDIEELQAQEYLHLEAAVTSVVWLYEPDVHTWVAERSGELMHDFSIPEMLQTLIASTSQRPEFSL